MLSIFNRFASHEYASYILMIHGSPALSLLLIDTQFYLLCSLQLKSIAYYKISQDV